MLKVLAGTAELTYNGAGRGGVTHYALRQEGQEDAPILLFNLSPAEKEELQKLHARASEILAQPARIALLQHALRLKERAQELERALR